jgi:hypothetical protein
MITAWSAHFLFDPEPCDRISPRDPGVLATWFQTFRTKHNTVILFFARKYCSGSVTRYTRTFFVLRYTVFGFNNATRTDENYVEMRICTCARRTVSRLEFTSEIRHGNKRDDDRLFVRFRKNCSDWKHKTKRTKLSCEHLLRCRNSLVHYKSTNHE